MLVVVHAGFLLPGPMEGVGGVVRIAQEKGVESTMIRGSKGVHDVRCFYPGDSEEMVSVGRMT